MTAVPDRLALRADLLDFDADPGWASPDPATGLVPGVRWRPDHWLLVEAGRITGVQPAAAFTPDDSVWSVEDQRGRLLMPGFIAVFAGIPFMLMVAKVQKLGAVFLMGLITALIYFATGQFTLVILISMASTCILAEVVRMVTKYNSFKGNSIAYVIFSLGMVGSPLPIWLFKADFLAQITEQGMPADYVAAVEALSSNAMLIVLFVAPIIGGIIGAFIARGLFKKHFVKAGIV